MRHKRIYTCLFVVFTIFFITEVLHSQTRMKKGDYNALIDSLDRRITDLRNRMPWLEKKRNLEFFNTKRELDHTLFCKAYNEYLHNEELDKAKSLVETRLEESEFKNDGLSIDFYRAYKKRIYDQIKQQRMHYQALFEKEKTFSKSLHTYLKTGTMESYERAMRMIDLSLKYAGENQLTEAEKYLRKYKSYVNALIFDLNSSFDLSKISSNQAAFDKVFYPLVSSDSLEQIRKAGELIEHCCVYLMKTGADVDTLFYLKRKLVVSAAIADYNDRIGDYDLKNIADQAVVARLDTLNPEGVYKWHDFIVIINEINPKYGSFNLKKGEAIMASDKLLFTYIRRQEIAKLKSDYKIRGTKFIPYKDGNQVEEFIYNHETKRWQYMICYETIENDYFTAEVRKYMPPLIFVQEEN